MMGYDGRGSMSKTATGQANKNIELPGFDALPAPAPEQGLQRIVEDSLVVILFHGQVFMSYQQDDGTFGRYVAVLCAIKKMATQAEIAVLWGVNRRTLVKWIDLYRRRGLSGIIGKAGRPVKIDLKMRRKIVQMRSGRSSVDEIAAALQISRGSVCEVLYGRLKKVEQELLPGLSSGQEERGEVLGEPVVSLEAEAAAPEQIAEVIGEQKSDELPGAPVDPMDRTPDRLKAYLGMMEDAEPVFAEHEHVAGAGALLALALFVQSGFLARAKNVYGSFGPAFYGLRSVFCTLFLMAVLRIVNPEKLDSVSPHFLGRLLGLDRSPTVKTLRSKLKALAGRKRAEQLMNQEAAHLIEGYDADQAVLLVDGHVFPYYGEDRVGKVFSTSHNRVIKGGTDYWVNLAGGEPLLCIPVSFNQHLNTTLPSLVSAARSVTGQRRLTVVFDRGGADAATYEKLIEEQHCDFIAYHKTPAAIEAELFMKQPIQINGRLYSYVPCERDIQLPVYEGRGRRRHKTDRTVALREIIVRREDGRTTHIITTRRDDTAQQIASILFGRWVQENFFKYMIQTYSFDHLYTYSKPSVPPGEDHPNPEYVHLQKQAESLRKKIGRALGRTLSQIAQASQEWINAQIAKLKKGKTGENLETWTHMLSQTQEAIKQTPERESTDQYVMLEMQTRLISMLVKCAAYRCEGALADMVKNHAPLKNGNYRGVVDAFMKTQGALCLEPGIIRIKLQPQSSPKRTRILQHVCKAVSDMQILYPDSRRVMIFEVAQKVSP
jgi:transposase-like protein